MTSCDWAIKVWNLANYKCLQTIPNPYIVYALKLLNNGNFASSAGDNNIRIWSTALFLDTQLSILSGHTNAIISIELLSDGTLASASYDNTVKIWDTNSGTLISSFNPFKNQVYFVKQVSLSPIILACVGYTNKLVYYNIQTNTTVQNATLNIYPAYSLVV